MLDGRLGETGWLQRSVATAGTHPSCVGSSSSDDTGSVYIYKFTLALVSGEQVCVMSVSASPNVATELDAGVSKPRQALHLSLAG